MNTSDNTSRIELAHLLRQKCLGADGSPADHARGQLAGLRKLLSPATRAQGLFALGSLGAQQAIGNPALETLAAAFAAHPHGASERRDFGATCRDLARRNGAKPGDSPFDRHFRRILASRNIEELREPLLSAVRLAKTSGVAVDFQRLEWDLLTFRNNPDPVLERWAKSYFDTREPAETTPANT